LGLRDLPADLVCLDYLASRAETLCLVCLDRKENPDRARDPERREHQVCPVYQGGQESPDGMVCQGSSVPKAMVVCQVMASPVCVAQTETQDLRADLEILVCREEREQMESQGSLDQRENREIRV